MKRWDSLVDGYMGVCEARGLSEEYLECSRIELDRWGCWMKRRRPKPQLEEVGHELLIEYLKRRTSFRAKYTVSSIASKMRCMGEYLVHQGVWQQNPMPWIKVRKNAKLGIALSAITASVVGVVLNVAVIFTHHTLVPDTGGFDWYALAASVVAFVGMQRLKWGMVPVIIGSAAAGLAWKTIL